MPGTVEHRSVTPLIKALRAFLRGRDPKLSLRYADLLAARTQPPPNLPDGPNHKLSKVYYYTRDARREVNPPFEISGLKQITTGDKVVTERKAVTPAKVYRWD